MGVTGEYERREEKKKKKKGKQPPQTHKHTRPCHTPALHTRTHTSAPSNNPLILFIISQLFLVRAIHERNHTHKHTPMCRAEIQYKYTHLYFLISSSIFTPCFFFFFIRCFFLYAPLCISHAVTHHNPTSMHRPHRNRKDVIFFLLLCLKSFAKLWRAHSFTLLIAFFINSRAQKKKIQRYFLAGHCE